MDAHVRLYSSSQRKNGFHFTEFCSAYRILRINLLYNLMLICKIKKMKAICLAITDVGPDKNISRFSVFYTILKFFSCQISFHVQPPEDAFYCCVSWLFPSRRLNRQFCPCLQKTSFSAPVIMPGLCNWVVIRKGGGFFLTFESDILFSLGRSRCSIFVSEIHIGNAKSSYAGVGRGGCQEDPVALFRNQRVIQQNQATQSEDQVHPVISLGLEDLHAFKLICNLVWFLFTYLSPAEFLWLLKKNTNISLHI